MWPGGLPLQFFFRCLQRESIPGLLRRSPARYHIANRASSLGKPSKCEAIVYCALWLPARSHPPLLDEVHQQSNGATPGFQVLKACDWSSSILSTAPSVAWWILATIFFSIASRIGALHITMSPIELAHLASQVSVRPLSIVPRGHLPGHK